MSARDKPFRIPIAFRVGVTGTRSPDIAALPALRRAVADVLTLVRQQCSLPATEPWASDIHAVDGGDVRSVQTILSPLAEGADRLVAEEALRLDYGLTVALPFEQFDYERDFPGSVAAFRSLLARAEGRVLALDGARGADEWRSYEAIGRLVTRNCDLMIAIWDDNIPSSGRGGTEDTVRFAASVGLPVWWLHASGLAPPVFIQSMDEFRNRARPLGEPEERLRGYIKALLTPPPAPHRPAQGIFHRLVAAGVWMGGLVKPSLRQEPEPLRTFLDEGDRTIGSLWRAHRESFISALNWGRRRSVAASPEAVDDYWTRIYEPPDRLSLAYSARYHSTYVYIFGLAALALIFAASALAMEASEHERWVAPTAIGELTVLVLIVALVLVNQFGRWHERWINYRLLAELCRKQQALATLGWSLPSHQVTSAAGAGTARGAWVTWYFNAAQRASPLATGTFAREHLAKARTTIQTSLLAGQIAYHEDRAGANERAGLVLFFLGDACFILTLIFVVAKIWKLGFGASDELVALGLAAAVLPAISAALFAIRAYSEFEVLVDQSERMRHLLLSLEMHLESIDLDRPLASQDLAVDLFDLVAAMLSDVGGWAQLFRLKAVEAG